MDLSGTYCTRSELVVKYLAKEFLSPCCKSLAERWIGRLAGIVETERKTRGGKAVER